METELISEEKANKVYDLLVSIGGANEDERVDFIYHHCEDVEYGGCREWRFGGNLGSGGKYRSITNTVTYYYETETPLKIELRDKLNYMLKNI